MLKEDTGVSCSIMFQKKDPFGIATQKESSRDGSGCEDIHVYN